VLQSGTGSLNGEVHHWFKEEKRKPVKGDEQLKLIKKY
jgi:hypothetical protein